MTESFKKLKRKHLIEAIIKSVVNGVSCGLFVVGVILLALKLSGIQLHFGFYILIGVVVAAGSGTGLFFLFRPTDLSTAKRLDKEYGLNEKVQTMVEFADQEGDILTLQREATGAALSNLPKPKMSFGGLMPLGSLLQYVVNANIWQSAISVVLAVSISAAAIVIPPVIIDNGPGTAAGDTGSNGDYEYALLQQSAIADLILDLRNSSLNEKSLKPAFINVVEQLDENLKNIDVESRMKQYVVAAVQLLDGLTDKANTYSGICKGLKNYDEELATAIINSVAVYKKYSAQLNNFRYIKALELELGDMIGETLQETVQATCTSLLLKSPDGPAEELNAFINGLKVVLDDSGVSTSDALYTCVNDLRVSLRNTYNLVGKGYGLSTLNGQINAAFEAFKNGLVVVLKEQSYNRIMDVYTRRKLADIFGVAINELPVLSDDGEGATGGNGSGGTGGEGGGDDEQGGGNGGGFGNGDVIFGSNDKIFDPDTGEYVEYGKLLKEYYEKFFERILNGDFDYVNDYFTILFGGLDNSNKN